MEHRKPTKSRRTSKSHPKGSKSDAQRRPDSSGCSRSRSKQPRAHQDTRSRQRGPTLRSRLWAEAHNPPSSRSTTSVPVSSSSHSSSSSSPGEASPPPPHASSSPSLHEITSTLRSTFDSLMDLMQDQEARISHLQSRLSALEHRPSQLHSGEQHVQDFLRTPPAPSSCSDQRGPVSVSPSPSTPDPSPCSDQRGPTPPTTCSTAVQAGFTSSTFECTLDGTSATSPATSSPDTCDSSTQVRYTRIPVSTSPDQVALQALADTISSVEKDDSFFTAPFSLAFADVISHISDTWRKYPSLTETGISNSNKFFAEIFHPDVDGDPYAYGEIILWFFLHSLGFSSFSACKNYKVPPPTMAIIQRYRATDPDPPTSSSSKD